MELVFNGLWPRGLRRQRCGTNRCGKVFGPLWIRGTACVCAASTHWNVSGKYGPHGEFFFFLLKKEPMVLSELVECGPCFSAEKVIACSLNGLHMMAEENALRSDRDSSPDLGEMWEYGCPKSPVWSGDGFEGKRSGDTSSEEYYEHKFDNLAVGVVRQNWSSQVISLFLEDWEVGRVVLIKLPLANGPFVPRNEGCVLGELRVSGFSSLLVIGVPGTSSLSM